MDDRDARLLEVPQEDLETRLGEYLLKDFLGTKPPGVSDKRNAARLWLESQKAAFRDLICNSPEVLSLVGRGGLTRDRNLLFFAVYDALAPRYGLAPIGSLTAMLIHYGIDALCSWEGQGS